MLLCFSQFRHQMLHMGANYQYFKIFLLYIYDMNFWENKIDGHFFYISALSTLSHLLPIITLDGRTLQTHSW